MKTSDLQELLEAADKNRDEIVLCLLGDPGIGKTQAVYQFAKEHGRNVVEIIASQILPSEVSGITMPDKDSKSMQIFDHARISSLKDGDILFFDELLQASPQVLSACLTLIQERRMMSGKMLPDIMIVAAANPIGIPSSIPLSIRQRFMFVDVEFDENEFKIYIRNKYDIELNDRLIDRIKTDSAEWNCLTPRTLDKLLSWRLNCDSKKERLMLKEFITKSFDSITADCIDRTCVKKWDSKIKDIADNHGIELDITQEIDQWLEILRKSDDWEDIVKELEEENEFNV